MESPDHSRPRPVHTPQLQGESSQYTHTHTVWDDIDFIESYQK